MSRLVGRAAELGRSARVPSRDETLASAVEAGLPNLKATLAPESAQAEDIQVSAGSAQRDIHFTSQGERRRDAVRALGGSQPGQIGKRKASYHMPRRTT